MAKSPIPVFKAERDAGLEAAIASNHSLAYVSPVVVAPENLRGALITEEALAAAHLALGQGTDFDLFPVYNIMVTTGWNKNDDIFERQETWMARYTPEDKPFNQGHIPSKIIGHITGSVLVDDGLTIIPDTSTFDDLPPKFHILARSVVYRHINSRDKDLQAEAAELIEGIKHGDWFVSMECLFTSFDYGLTTASGEQQIITRNEKTAFLTKHLRIYEGTGEYNGCKLGRILRNITFSGKGLVKNPANPESVILNDAQNFVGVLASFNEGKEHEIHASVGEKNMSEELLKEQVSSLQKSLADANRKLEELGEKQVQAALASKDAEITKLQSASAEQAKKIDELTASYNASVEAKKVADAEVTTLKTAKVEVDTKLAEADKQLATIKAEALKASRISTLVDKGVDKAAAEAIVTKFAGASDETFAEIVTMQSELVEAKKKTPPMPLEGDKKGGDCPGKSKADETTDPKGEQAAAGADINNAKPDADPAMSTSDEDKNGEVIAALASFFDEKLNAGRGTQEKK